MLKLTYLGTMLFFGLGILVLYWSFVARKRAVAEHAKVNRLFESAKRALLLIESDKTNEILVGLQLLSVYDIASIRIKAIPRLIQLTEHDNKQIVELAKHIIELSQSADIPQHVLNAKTSQG